jgi:L-glyceraldehyde 3-phosphate reductase
MFERWVEDGLLEVLDQEEIGCIPFSPLAKEMLTDKYLTGMPVDSRTAKTHEVLKDEQLTKATLAKIYYLNIIAQARNQSLAQIALAWLLKYYRVYSVISVILGVSKPEQ